MSEVTFRDAKVAVTRAMEILEEIYPSRILNKRATEQGSVKHLAWLARAAEVLDQLDHSIDVRPNLDPRKRQQSTQVSSEGRRQWPIERFPEM